MSPGISNNLMFCDSAKEIGKTKQGNELLSKVSNIGTSLVPVFFLNNIVQVQTWYGAGYWCLKPARMVQYHLCHPIPAILKPCH